MLGEWIQHANRYGENAIGLMFRRTRTELMDTIERSRVIYGPLGGTYNESEKIWTRPNGARLRVRVSRARRRRRAYQGHSYSRVYCEEGG